MVIDLTLLLEGNKHPEPETRNPKLSRVIYLTLLIEWTNHPELETRNLKPET
jgi:hypothetical protein